VKLETVTISNRRMYRLSLNGTIRTAPVPETLATLRAAARQERASILQLQRDAADATAQVQACIGRGDSAAACRASLARIQAEIAAATERADRIDALAGEVRADAVEGYAQTLRQQCDDTLSAIAAALPPIPTLETHHD
jgi:hypothetical protein